ncbi:MAG: hypothetical protein A2469_04760 [Candidatus Magasanikbacteria bacterium RIFOXYC2_FULL_40_16]|nr:MAG: hypothetical protein A2469_04760 [Candidatus Magasanikbacteria bacterium RIFOXYC2_FULL_40_16]
MLGGRSAKRIFSTFGANNVPVTIKTVEERQTIRKQKQITRQRKNIMVFRKKTKTVQRDFLSGQLGWDFFVFLLNLGGPDTIADTPKINADGIANPSFAVIQ